MLTQGFGEVLTDILTVNPALKTISFASSILDTSNYTFNAITLGKDAAGYGYYAHTVYSLEPLPVLIVNGGKVLAVKGNNNSASSFETSSIKLALSSTYKSIPQYPSIYNKKLEDGNTRSFFENLINDLYGGVTDLGHYKNTVIDSNILYSSYWNVISPYPPSGNSTEYALYNSNLTFICSGNLSGVFNSRQVIDSNGFIKINEAINVTSVSAGPYITSSANFTTSPGVILGIKLEKGDAVGLALFGGVNHIGVWCLDLKEMLKSGLNPPYSWNNLNNNRKYKLVGKVTFWDDILYHEDVAGTSGLSLLDSNGVLIKLKFNFK